MDYATSCVQKGLDYFEQKFFHDFQSIMDAFKSARLFDPGKVIDLRPTAATIDSLKSFPFIGDDLINNLKTELPTYLTAADGTPRQVNCLEWWDHNKESLPYWTQGFS